MKLPSLIAAFFITCFGSLFAQDAKASFPSEVSFTSNGQTYQLELTGTAVRKKMIYKIYTVAHYLENARSSDHADALRLVMDPDRAKQLTLHWERSLSPQQVQDGFVDAFKKVPTNGNAQSEIQEFIGLFSQGVQKGDETVLRWTHDGAVEVLLNGQPAADFSNEAFAKALWSVWFGKDSVVDRNALVSRLR